MKTPHLFELAPQLLEISGARRNSSSAFIFQIAIAGSRQINRGLPLAMPTPIRSLGVSALIGKVVSACAAGQCLRRLPPSNSSASW